MAINSFRFLFISSFLVFICETNAASVSPKIDFVDGDKNDPIPPKIQSVRVIVEANKLNDDNPETVVVKASDGKKSVGIRTDITVELSDNKTDSIRNAENDDDDREVPVFLGTDLANGRTQVQRRYDPNTNQPHFYGTNDDANSFNGGDAGTWIRFLPSGNNNGWTTEKYYPTTRRYNNNRGFIPYGIDQKSFVPCVCPNGEVTWQRGDVYPPNTHRRSGVDKKLEKPFQ